MKFKHTPGPWKAWGIGGLELYISRGDDVCEIICNLGLPHHVDECEEKEANAHLIAAAPDMLEALIMVKKYGHSGYTEGSKPDIEFWFKIDTIIERATCMAIDEVLKCGG